MIGSRRPTDSRWGAVLDVAAERFGDQELITDRPPDIEPSAPCALDYARWAQMCARASGWLHAAGVEPGDRVALMKGNHADILILSCAAARIGALPVQLAWTHPPNIAKTLLERMDRPVLVTDQARLESCDITEEDTRRLTKRVVSVDGADGRSDVVALDDLRGEPVPPARPRGLDEPMVVTHTSGTTGAPKLVMHSAHTIEKLTWLESERWPLLGLRSDDTVLFCDPYFHARLTTGLVAATTVGPKMLLMSDPEPATVRRFAGAHRPTVVETVPNAFLTWEALADDPSQPFRNTRLFLNTFDAIHVRSVRTLMAATRRRFPVWVQSWGQSEAGPVTMRPYVRRSVRPRGRRMPATRENGWAMPLFSKVRVVDRETLEPIGRGEVGLIEVSQPGRCLDYMGEHERWESKRRNGWWNTGDLGVMSRSRSVRLVDREIDRIPGASAIELEDVLLDRLPQSTEVIVLADPDGPPVPILSTTDDVPVPPHEWEAATADLPALASPRFIGWDEFPRTATWKVQRLKLREHVIPGHAPLGSGRWT